MERDREGQRKTEIHVRMVRGRGRETEGERDREGQ